MPREKRLVTEGYRRMELKAVSRVMSTLLLIGVHSILLLSIFAITPVGLAHEEPQPSYGDLWWPYVPSPEQVTLDFWMAEEVAYVNVTIQFYIPCFNITDWGTVTESNYDIWVDSEIWLWKGFCIQIVPPPVSHTYELGYLESGTYAFMFRAWNETIKSIEFVIKGFEPVHNINTGLNYTTIQAAIDATETLDGHTIFVEEGTYYENVVVNKTVSLFGENWNTTVVEGVVPHSMWQSVIAVPSDLVTIANFTVTNGYTGIYLRGRRSTVTDCVAHDNTFGLIIDPNIAFGYSTNVLRRNQLFNNTYNLFVLGAWYLNDYVQDIDSSNLVNGKPVHYLVNEENISIDPDTYPNIGYLGM